MPDGRWLAGSGGDGLDRSDPWAALAATGADGAGALTGGSQLSLVFAAALIAAAIGVAWTIRRADGVAQPGRESEATTDIEAMPDAA